MKFSEDLLKKFAILENLLEIFQKRQITPLNNSDQNDVQRCLTAIKKIRQASQECDAHAVTEIIDILIKVTHHKSLPDSIIASVNSMLLQVISKNAKSIENDEFFNSVLGKLQVDVPNIHPLSDLNRSKQPITKRKERANWEKGLKRDRDVEIEFSGLTDKNNSPKISSLNKRSSFWISFLCSPESKTKRTPEKRYSYEGVSLTLTQKEGITALLNDSGFIEDLITLRTELNTLISRKHKLKVASFMKSEESKEEKKPEDGKDYAKMSLKG